MNKLISPLEYFVAWIVWIISAIITSVILSFAFGFIDVLLIKLGIEVSIGMRNLGGLITFVVLFFSLFVVFAHTVKHMIVRRVKERVKQEVHQRYQKLLEEKGIQLEDSNV